MNFIIGNLSKSAKILNFIWDKKFRYTIFELTFFFSNFFTFLFSQTVLQYRYIINKITLFVFSLLISISWNTIFLKSKQIMPLDKANIQFLINTNSCELKVHSKNKCLKGILSTSCVIFSYPKLLSISVLTFIKWRLTPSYAAKDKIFWQKRPKTIVIVIIVRMTIFKSIHMIFYVNTSWACALFINNKQHVEKSVLWRIQR